MIECLLDEIAKKIRQVFKVLNKCQTNSNIYAYTINKN